MGLFTLPVAPVARAGNRIEGRHVRKRVKALKIEQFLAVAVGALGLRPSVVHVEPVAGPDPLHHSVENLPVVFVLIESEMNEVVEGPGRLRGRLGVDALDVTLDRVRRAGVVVRCEPQERIEVADGRESQPVHRRVLGHVGEFVDVVVDEIPRGQLDRGVGWRSGV